jgi:Fe2+ transport system protein FeoA
MIAFVKTKSSPVTEYPIQFSATASLVPLLAMRKGSSFIIRRIDDASVRTQLIRFGLAEGSTVKCHEKIPFGPIILKRTRQELALGRELAAQIFVELL